MNKIAIGCRKSHHFAAGGFDAGIKIRSQVGKMDTFRAFLAGFNPDKGMAISPAEWGYQAAPRRSVDRSLR
jgi:hypothetical protein